MGQGTSLTWVMMGLVGFVGIMMLVFSTQWGIYNNIMSMNGKGVDAKYANAYNNLTATQQTIDRFSENYTALGTWSIMKEAVSLALTVFNIGASAIRLFASLPKMLTEVFSTISTMTLTPQPIYWMVTSILTIYLISKLIKALRGTVDEI
jgi:hypothetical protein